MPIPHTTPRYLRPGAARSFLVAVLPFCLAFVAVAFMSATVEAQGGGKKTNKKDKGKKEATTKPPPPPSGPPGGLGEKKVRRNTTPIIREKTTETADPNALPSDYVVPPEPPDPLTTLEEWHEDPFVGSTRSKVLAQYNAIRTAGEFANDDQRKLVAVVVRYKLSEFTLKDNREKVPGLRNKLLQDVATSPSLKTGPRQVRIFMLKTIAEEAPKLFKYHIVARINGAILLAELSDPAYNEFDGDLKKPSVPFVGGAQPLLALVKDTEQLTAPRVWGINGLVRLAALTEIKPQLRDEIVNTLVSLMDSSKDEHEWYQWRLAEGLGKLTVIQNQAKRPVVAQSLAQVLADQTRPALVRAEAAQSLGRLPLTPEINAELIAYLTANLVQQMTDAYNKQPKAAIWKLCFIKAYGAFKPVDDEQKRALLLQVEKGSLAAHKTKVTEAFNKVLPLVSRVVGEQSKAGGTAEPLKELNNWLKANPPNNLKLSPDEEPIVIKKQPSAGSPPPLEEPAAATAGGP